MTNLITRILGDEKTQKRAIEYTKLSLRSYENEIKNLHKKMEDLNFAWKIWKKQHGVGYVSKAIYNRRKNRILGDISDLKRSIEYDTKDLKKLETELKTMREKEKLKKVV